jgi:PAS domain S-box-containing protein
VPVLVALPVGVDSTLWFEAGFDDVLHLPIAEAELLARLSVFLRLREQLEEKTRRTEERFRVLIENAPDGITLLDADEKFQYVSPSTARILGYTPEQAVGSDPFSVLHPEDAAMMRDLLADLRLKPGASVQAVYRIQHSDGSWHWMESTITNLLNEPSVRGILFNYRDINDRKLAEEALHVREQSILAFQNHLKQLHEVSIELAQINTLDALYRNVVLLGRERLGFDRLGLFLVQDGPNTVVGTYGTDPQGELRYEAATTFELDRASLIRESVGNRWNVILWPETDLWDRMKVIGRGWNLMAMLGNPADPIGWLAADNLIHHEPLHDDQIELLSLYASMIGALLLKMQADKKLRDSQTSLAAAQQIAKIGSWELDLTNLEALNVNPLRWSDEVFRIFGYEPGAIEVSNDNFFKAVHPDDRAAINAAVARALQDGTQYSIDHRIICQDGTERIVHEQSDIVYDEETGKPQMMVGTIQDVTEQRQAEALLAAKNEELRSMTEQLWQAAKLATMGELAASLAHELNNPLAIVNLRVESLLAQTAADAPGRRSLEIVEQEVERMARLVTNLLHFSRRSTRQVSTLNVCEEINNTLELVQFHLRNRQIEVINSCDADLPLITGDRQQLRQLFLNLFTNASDAMMDGGTLIIKVTAPEDKVLIEVSDNGTGISPENMTKIMEPFFTTKPEGKGTGLGLAICRRIVHEHGGTFELTSSGVAGEGTKVRVLLPTQHGANHSHLAVGI